MMAAALNKGIIMAIVLSCNHPTLGTISIRLPSPEFDNSDKLDYSRINRKTRGGDLIIFRDPTWPRTRILGMKFTGMDQPKVRKLLDFIKSTLGLTVHLVNYDGLEYDGIIITPTGEVTQPGVTDFNAGFDLQVQ